MSRLKSTDDGEISNQSGALNVDKEGFLRDLSDWNEAVAIRLAAQHKIALSAEHWEIINLTRQYYATFNISPATRVLVNQVKRVLGTTKGSSIHLMQLFGGKPARLIANIAGLPKPNNCD